MLSQNDACRRKVQVIGDGFSLRQNSLSSKGLLTFCLLVYLKCGKRRFHTSFRARATPLFWQRRGELEACEWQLNIIIFVCEWRISTKIHPPAQQQSVHGHSTPSPFVSLCAFLHLFSYFSRPRTEHSLHPHSKIDRIHGLSVCRVVNV